MDILPISQCGEVPAGRRRPGTAGSGHRSEFEHSSRCPDPAACAQRAQASPPFFFIQSFVGRAPLPNKEDERQNRRAGGALAGEKRCDDESSHSEFVSFSPATGDFESPVVLPERYGSALPTQPPLLCVFAPLRYWVGGGICAHLRYLRFLRANGSVFICVICGQLG